MDPNYATLAIILGDGAHSGVVRETANGREWILSGQRNRVEGSLQKFPLWVYTKFGYGIECEKYRRMKIEE
ncbi:hypothetical protein CEXT_141211 [Caerostris extrusa]|uniref:LAGLIDADG homing endonuclease n=1 Tax=Caerostris extrusa TaxID=172846 RepID=A0AAV4SCA7_CAEEX|nr:hypothetical protein CEXT_141211 [Caerostris extrusa]